eukprot:CAMPEP_0170086302 /NCGR_PEP_ID=MMETSP0019_2-20121128/21017_1 /TAXON_ID=98059 /ORGANISM="Dinobryon sp., Strain UTEXLB2267" /LENGTH=405 /DNA_ID=CAMNT_0010303291 /DNA_START=222 /DNA_END=1439 /DNA_ORIENTATION=-
MTALALRELSPISSQAAVLPGFRLLFRGSGGMATAEKLDSPDINIYEVDEAEYPFEGVHGVLHLLTVAHSKILDEFEGGYSRMPCKVKLYNGTEVQAFYYQMDRNKWAYPNDSLPTERYLDIISQGCVSHGIANEWVQFIRNHKCISRKNTVEFSTFAMTTANVPILSWEEIRKCDGKDDKKLWIVINNKVLEFKGDRRSFFPFGYFVKHDIGGTDFTVRFAKAFFEPKYKIHSATATCCELEVEHRAWVEDQFANPPPVLSSSKWTMVGVVTSDNAKRSTLRRSFQLATHLQLTNDIVDLSDCINAGINQVFVTGHQSGVWNVPDGTYEGQTLHIRKTADVDFTDDVVILIRNQDLSSPNKRSQSFVMTPRMYSLAWCWDGRRWLLESVGQAAVKVVGASDEDP